MSKIDKIKRIILIVLGFSLSAYLMYGGFEILSKEDANTTKEAEVK